MNSHNGFNLNNHTLSNVCNGNNQTLIKNKLSKNNVKFNISNVIIIHSLGINRDIGQKSKS